MFDIHEKIKARKRAQLASTQLLEMYWFLKKTGSRKLTKQHKLENTGNDECLKQLHLLEFMQS